MGGASARVPRFGPRYAHAGRSFVDVLAAKRSHIEQGPLHEQEIETRLRGHIVAEDCSLDREHTDCRRGLPRLRLAQGC